MDRQSLSPKSKKPVVTKFKIIKNMVLISTSFVLLFIGYDGLSMLQSTINKKHGIGVITQALGYIAFCISSLFIPTYVIKKIGCKYTIVVSLAVFLPFIAANFYPDWITMLPTALFIGSGAATLWGAQSTYFNECSYRYCRLLEKEEKLLLKEMSPVRNNNDNTSSTDFNSDKLQKLSSMILETIKDGNKRTRLVNDEDVDSPSHCSEYGFTNYGMVNSDDDNEIDTNALGNKLHSRNPVGGDSRVSKLSPIDETAPVESVSYSKPDVITTNCDTQNFICDTADTRQRSESFMDAVTNVSTLESVTARFFSCHALAYYVSQILSNVMTYYILMSDEDMDDDKPFGCACGASYCNTDPLCFDEDDDDEISNRIRYILSGTCLAIATLGVLVVLFFLDPVENNFRGLKKKEPVKLSFSLAFATFEHCKKKEQLFLVPLIIYIGMLQGFYTADLTKSYVACAWGTSHIGQVSIAFGVACVVAASISGFVVKYIGRLPIFMGAQLLNIVTFVYMLLWIPHASVPYKFFLAAGMFGLITGMTWAQLLAFHGVLFKDEQEAAFASYYLFSSVGWTTSFLYSDHICTWIKIYILLGASFVGTAGYLVTEQMFLKKKEYMQDLEASSSSY